MLSGRHRTAQPANGVLSLALAPSPLPVHREPTFGYKKPPRDLEATRTTPSTLPHHPTHSATLCTRQECGSSAALHPGRGGRVSVLDIIRGRPRQHGRAAPLFSSPHPSVPFLSRPGTHPHAFIIPRSTPGARRRGGPAGTNELRAVDIRDHPSTRASARRRPRASATRPRQPHRRPTTLGEPLCSPPSSRS